MRPDPGVRPNYLAAFSEIVKRIQATLAGASRRALPVRMYVAGGAALHLYTAARVSEDIDAVFSRRIVLPEHLEVAYRDVDGAARMLYFDRQYNDTLGLLHEDAHEDSLPVSLEGVDISLIEVRLLSPVDLAVSKIGRLADQDREDIATLAQRGMITTAQVRKRAEEALAGYVGDVSRVRNSIEIACRIIDDASPRKPGARRPR